jgi:hypothetical protein
MTISLLEAVERQLALLATKRAAVEVRIAKATVAHQRLAFEALALGDKEARTQTDASAAALAAMAYEAANLDAAKAEANRRKAAAEQADKRTVNTEHVKRVHALLDQLVPLGKPLDAHTGEPRGNSAAPQSAESAFRYLRDPASQQKCAALVGATLTELRALDIARDVTFPNRLWDVANRTDLLKAILDVMTAGWRHRVGSLSHAERNNFVALLSAWAKFIRADLARHEQTNEQEVAA